MSLSNRAVLLIVAAVLLGGCTGFTGSPPSPTTAPPTSSTTTGPTPATSPTPATPTATERRVSTTEMTPEYGTEFVSVGALDDQSRHTEWPDEQTVAFENLSDARQEAFLEALSDGEASFPPNANPFAFSDKERPRVVHYDGTWYFVRVAIV